MHFFSPISLADIALEGMLFKPVLEAILLCLGNIKIYIYHCGVQYGNLGIGSGLNKTLL